MIEKLIKQNKIKSMKQILILAIAFISFSAFDLGKVFPVTNLKTLEGKTVSTSDYIGKGKPVVVSFWATWCSPCKRELDAIAELYPEWKEKYGVEIIAITVDDARGFAKVPGMVQSKGWDYTVLSDSKQEMQQLLNFQSIPQSFLMDGQGNIVFSHSGYSPGDEFELEDEIKKITGK
jgi:peroxiredoxin